MQYLGWLIGWNRLLVGGGCCILLLHLCWYNCRRYRGANSRSVELGVELDRVGIAVVGMIAVLVIVRSRRSMMAWTGEPQQIGGRCDRGR
jgi:hypothetical protein